MSAALLTPVLTYAHPTVDDGADMWALVKHTKVLDPNSVYAYLLICRDFSNTSMLARDGRDLVGMVTGYVPPQDPETLFVWQVAVHSSMRGVGLAGRLLDQLLDRAPKGVRYIETTVSPSNAPSRRLFKKFAERHGARLDLKAGFDESLFPGDDHESEPRLVIGPLKQAGAIDTMRIRTKL